MKILVTDDHVLIRESLRGVFSELRPEAAIVEATDAWDTMRLIAEQLR
jgi:DNA-binding NarL/FixJ family response regulator